MSEFPKHPSKREIKRSEAVSLIIKGIGHVAVETPPRTIIEGTELAQQQFMQGLSE